jgi:large repetitive protein
MASQGPNSPGTAANDSSTGTLPWSNVNNILSSNNVYSTNVGVGGTEVTQYLKATNFGFSIPSGATIDGIVVEFERKSNFNTGSLNISDKILQLVKGGTIVGYDLSDSGTAWSTTEAYFTYGGSSNLWGTSWTYTDINASTFGVVLSIQFNNATKSSVTAFVDHVRITVYYTASGGPTSASALFLAGN